jgi:hypothetical protein
MLLLSINYKLQLINMINFLNIIIWLSALILSKKLIPLTNFYIGADSYLKIILPDFIPGSITSYTLEGSYNTSISKTVAETKSLEIINSIPVSNQSNTSSIYLFSDTIYYTSSNGVIIYNIQNLSDTNVLNYSNTSIVSVFPVQLSTGNFLISLSSAGLFQVINLTNGQEIEKMRIEYNTTGYISCEYLSGIDYTLAYPYNSSAIGFIKFDLLVNFTSVLFWTYSSKDLNSTLNIVKFMVSKELAYICDSAIGIIEFYIDPFLETPTSNLNFIQYFQHNRIFGNATVCSISDAYLSLGTAYYMSVYKLPYLDFYKVYSGNFTSLNANSEYIVGFNGNVMTVYASYLDINQAMIVNVSMQSESWILSGDMIILYNNTHIVFYKIQIPQIIFLPQYENYEYTGYLDISSIAYPIHIIGSYNSQLFSFQGLYPQSGYMRPTAVQSYSFNLNFNLVLPLSNYFCGNNVTYTFASSQGLASVVPKHKLLSSYSINSNTSNIKATPQYLILISTNNVNITTFTNNILTNYSYLTPSVPKATINDCIIYKKYAIIESYSNSYVYIDIYSLEGQIVQTLNSNSISYKLIAYNGFLFDWTGNCIYIYSIETTKYLPPICSTNVSLSISILDVAVFNGLCILNTTNLVIYSSPDNYNYTSIELPQDSYVSMTSTSNFLLVFSSEFVYKYSLHTYEYKLIPMPCPFASFSVSEQFLSINCDNAIILDLYSDAINDIYDEISINGVFKIAGTEQNSNMGYELYNGQINIYSIGTYEASIYIPEYSKITSVWGTFSLNAANHTTNLELTLTACNEYGSDSTNISLKVLNPYYIEQNPDFKMNDSLVTNGIINVTLQNFSAPMPMDAFKGNNIIYQVLVDGNLVNTSSLCDFTVDICIESKIYKKKTYLDDSIVYDFWVEADKIILASNLMLDIYAYNGTCLNLIQNINLTDYFDEYFSGYYFICTSIVMLSDETTIILACTFYYAVPLYYIVSGNADKINSVYQIWYPVKWMSVSENTRVYIYLYEGAGLYVLEYINKKIEFVSYYTNATLQTPFFPISAEYYNSTTILVVDRDNGLLLLSNNSISPYISFNSSISNYFLLSDSVIVLTTGGDGYRIRLNDSIILQQYYKLYPQGYIPSNMKAGISQALGILVYPIYNVPSSGYLRVLNYTTGFIYSDYLITNYGPDSSFRRVYVNDTGEIYHDLSVAGHGLPLQVLGIRNEPNIYIRSTLSNKNSSLNVVGVSGYNMMNLSQVLIVYPGFPSAKKATSSNIWEVWWFWVLVLGCTFVFFMFFYMFVIKKTRKRRNLSSEYVEMHMGK